MSNFLEVDPKILENNFLVRKDSPCKADDFENFFRSADGFSVENAPWKFVTPIPGSCIKTTDEKKKKVFINLCQLNEIPEPKDITDSELLELWQSEDASDYRIPLSMQDPHDELDKAGNPVVVYDVAVNAEFFKKIGKSQILRAFVLQVVLEGIENKYDLSLNKDGYVILQNRKCLGELKPHRIRVQKGPYVPAKRMIEELPASREKAETATPESSKSVRGGGDGGGTSKRVEFRFFENTLTNCLIGEFHLPDIITTKDVNLDVGEDRLIVESHRCHYFTDLFFPLKVDESNATANFNRKNKILTVRMPIVAV